MSDGICVLAWREPGATEINRGDRLHFCADVQLMASELNREYPDVEHWAAPATDYEIAVHTTQAARLVRLFADQAN
jgi:hypothetical protein